MIQLKKYRALLLLCCIYSTLQAFNNSYFYRASSFWDEPRFERQYLSSFAIELTGGSTCISRDRCGRKVSLLSILTPKKELDGGTIDVFEVDAHYTQNFCAGFFTEITVPFTTVQVRPSLPDACKNCSAVCLQAFNTACQLSTIQPCHRTELIDSTLLLGWTSNNENTTVLDFIDTTVKIGALLPTSKRTCSNNLLAIPLGYNKQAGFVASATVSTGLYDWLTAGAHVDSIIFTERPISLGTLLRVGAYGKADHIYKGLSLSLAFTYERQSKARAHTQVSSYMPLPLIKGWSRSLVHLMVDYDFARSEQCSYPRITLIYNRHLRGKRVFELNTLGTYLTCDISWGF